MPTSLYPRIRWLHGSPGLRKQEADVCLPFIFSEDLVMEYAAFYFPFICKKQVPQSLWPMLWRAFVTFFSANRVAAADDRTTVNARAERILAVYGNNILRLSYSYLHNMEDAEEVVQDTLVQFLKTTPEFADETHEKAWLLRVAGNLSKNRIKYNKLRETDELNEELAAENREDLSFVWQAVRELPVKYREVIHLFYYEGYTTAQIAKILKKNEATVRSCLSRGRERLKTILKEEYDFDGILS